MNTYMVTINISEAIIINKVLQEKQLKCLSIISNS